MSPPPSSSHTTAPTPRPPIPQEMGNAACDTRPPLSKPCPPNQELYPNGCRNVEGWTGSIFMPFGGGPVYLRNNSSGHSQWNFHFRFRGHLGHRWLSQDRIVGFETGVTVEGTARGSKEGSVAPSSFDPLISGQLELGLPVFASRETLPIIYLGPEGGLRFWDRPGGTSPETWFGGRLGFGLRSANFIPLGIEMNLRTRPGAFVESGGFFYIDIVGMFGFMGANFSQGG